MADGIAANREQCERHAELTLSAAAALNPYIGYDTVSQLVESILDEALDYHAMAKPHG